VASREVDEKAKAVLGRSTHSSPAEARSEATGVPDILNLILWLVAGVAGGNAAGAMLDEDYDLGPGNSIAGAIGGVIGAQILHALIPALRALEVGPIVGQMIGAAASGAFLTVIAGLIAHWRRMI